MLFLLSLIFKQLKGKLVDIGWGRRKLLSKCPTFRLLIETSSALIILYVPRSLTPISGCRKSVSVNFSRKLSHFLQCFSSLQPYLIYSYLFFSNFSRLHVVLLASITLFTMRPFWLFDFIWLLVWFLCFSFSLSYSCYFPRVFYFYC